MTSGPVPFNRPDVPPFEAVAAEIRAALESGSLTKGPHLAAFEREAAAAIGTEHVVGVSSCTTGLMLVLRAIAADDYRYADRPPIARYMAMAIVAVGIGALAVILSGS